MTRVTPPSIAYVATQVNGSQFTLFFPNRVAGSIRTIFFTCVLQDGHSDRFRAVLRFDPGSF
jgi:hypothetical protein